MSRSYFCLFGARQPTTPIPPSVSVATLSGPPRVVIYHRPRLDQSLTCLERVCTMRLSHPTVSRASVPTSRHACAACLRKSAALSDGIRQVAIFSCHASRVPLGRGSVNPISISALRSRCIWYPPGGSRTTRRTCETFSLARHRQVFVS